ncbi:tRNA-splicing endonuclease subunit Sen15-like [Oscarella lobularis]|uniref:tRNA-splicing endonuclease subunit Sen15-like n=1 Tax=Oscarella lobularis TaxID=121494 RepID=UPI003313D54C
MSDWILDHPEAARMSAFGFDDDVQLRVSMLVYLDLCEAKGWADVRACGCDELGVIYLTAQEKPDSVIERVVPLPLEYRLSMRKMRDLLANVGPPPNDSKSHRLILAIVESTSTIVYYYLHEGFCPPSETSLSRKIVQPSRKSKKKTNADESAPSAKKRAVQTSTTASEKDSKAT